MGHNLALNEKFFRYSIIWATFSSFIVLLIIKAGFKNQSVFALKDLIIYGMSLMVVGEILAKKYIGLGIILILLLTLSLYVNYIWLNPLYKAAINNFRQILAPPVLLIIFCSLKLSYKGCNDMLNLMCKMVIIVFAFGFIEQTFQLWSKFDLSVYFRLKRIPTDSKGMSYMFYEPRFGNRERMTSLFLDPISLGHFFASAGILLFYIKEKTKLMRIAFYCCLVGLFLALSKGAILQFIIGVFFFNNRIFLPVRAVSGIVPIVIVQALDSAGIKHHIQSFINAINTISLFGYGIGNAGNYSIMFGGGSRISRQLSISDTYIGSLLGQIGLINTLFWLLVCVLAIYIGGERFRHINTSLKIFISIFSISILSENTMNVTSFLLPAMMIAIASQLDRYEYEKKYERSAQPQSAGA